MGSLLVKRIPAKLGWLPSTESRRSRQGRWDRYTIIVECEKVVLKSYLKSYLGDVGPRKLDGIRGGYPTPAIPIPSSQSPALGVPVRP